jgi:O-antigen ligase
MRVHQACAVVAALFLAASVFGHTVALRMLLLAAGIVLAAIVVAKEKDVRALPPIWIAFVLWGAWALLSLAWSVDPGFSWKEWRNEVFYTGAGLWVCYVGAQARHAEKIFGAIMAGAAITVCAVALAEFSQGFGEYQVGWHGGPGDHSSALVIVMPCAAVAGWYAAQARHPAWLRWTSMALVALFFASAYTTLNKAIWLAFAVQFALLGGFLLRRRSPGRLSGKATGLVVILAVALLAVCGAVIVSIQSDRQAIGMARAFENDTRLKLYPEVLARILERPVLGHGFGRGIARDSLQAALKSTDPHLWHAHNIFLEALLQLGLPGLGLLLYLLWRIARPAWQHTQSSDEAAACGMALIAVLAGMLARNMPDSLLARQNALLFWGIVGVLLAWGARRWRA